MSKRASGQKDSSRKSSPQSRADDPQRNISADPVSRAYDLLVKMLGPKLGSGLFVVGCFIALGGGAPVWKVVTWVENKALPSNYIYTERVDPFRFKPNSQSVRTRTVNEKHSGPKPLSTLLWGESGVAFAVPGGKAFRGVDLELVLGIRRKGSSSVVEALDNSGRGVRLKIMLPSQLAPDSPRMFIVEVCRGSLTVKCEEVSPSSVSPLDFTTLGVVAPPAYVLLNVRIAPDHIIVSSVLYQSLHDVRSVAALNTYRGEEIEFRFHFDQIESKLTTLQIANHDNLRRTELQLRSVNFFNPKLDARNLDQTLGRLEASVEGTLQLDIPAAANADTHFAVHAEPENSAGGMRAYGSTVPKHAEKSPLGFRLKLAGPRTYWLYAQSRNSQLSYAGACAISVTPDGKIEWLTRTYLKLPNHTLVSPTKDCLNKTIRMRPYKIPEPRSLKRNRRH